MNKTPDTLILSSMTVADFAQKVHKPVTEVITTLLKQGTVASKNQVISEKTVASLAQIYGIKTVAKVEQAQEKLISPELALHESSLKPRLPVVVVIGHVDHGKTTLLDYIRKTRVATREKGGITQHLGAYEVTTAHGNIVFLDTPGHEAFSLIRVRGLKVADIAILVVAADDGVMPQTIEAIKRAKAAQIPIIVAINKIDKATPAQVETVKRQLAQHDLLPEDWGGQTVCVAISAKLGTGVDELLDVISLQAQLLELKANYAVPAQGYVLESKLEKGRGPVATVICLNGQLSIGDYFVCGAVFGKVSSLVNSAGIRIKTVPPSLPVLVAGFEQLPHAGDIFQVISPEDYKKRNAVSLSTAAETGFQKGATEQNAIPILLKTDNASSREALVRSLEALSAKLPKKFAIVHAALGDVSESDIMLAFDTHALIYSFHVKTEPHALALLHKYPVTIKHFDIIYKLLEDLEAVAEAGRPIEYISKKIGEAIVLKVFDIKNLGVVAGALVKTGRFVRDGKVVVWRGKQKVGEGTIKGLQREKKSVKEVHAGFECGFLVDGFSDWQVDDRVECFQEVPVESK
jgi:translation initiation factor IF-2